MRHTHDQLRKYRQPIWECAICERSSELDGSIEIDYRKDYKLFVCSDCYLELEDGKPDKGDLHETLYDLRRAKESEDEDRNKTAHLSGAQRRELANVPLLLREDKDESPGEP